MKPGSFWIRMLGQGGLIVAAALASALLFNAVRPGGLALVGDWSTEARFRDDSGGSMAISLKQAREWHAQGAVFLDARSPDLYREGHIQGARNLPWESFNALFDRVMGQTPEDVAVVAYCDGESCDLSHELALALRAFGYAKARVLVNGWTVWREAGLPVGKGGGGERSQ